ncbi:hybrid sensor histidine kinase/response regulator transcription factor [Pedobacter endophyticus]|uniref:histidine kinase n=1 Tax=Pedobacter endophyticus TaxID=2789740 RepID=A0A7S9Q0G0_9SPHI|nr:two-component regulator propeller domain-containing protein [Pedobacter endophyticus]QPH40940.1 response regulator [Pedobacter endophyticus]
MKKRILFILSIVILNLYCKAQELIFNHLMTENGLSQNSIFAITQDSHGFMWYGSRFGLNRYDGNQFRLYKSNAADSNTLTDDYITALYSDTQGILWVGTANGLNKFNPKKNTFERIYLNQENPTHTHNGIKNIYQDRTGHLWVATNHGLYLLANRNINQFVSAGHFGLPGNIAKSEILSIYEDKDGFLWIGTNQGLSQALFNKRLYLKKTFTSSEISGSLSDNAVTDIIEDNQHNLWIATENGGLNLFNKKSQTFTPFLHREGNNNSIVHNAIRRIIKHSSGELWIGTQEGLSIFDPITKNFRTFQHRKANFRSLNQNSIYSIYEDLNGSVWIGTYYGGVNVAYANPTDFKSWQYNDKLPGISHNVISSISETSANNLWIGTEGGGLNYYDWASGGFTAYKHTSADYGSIGSDLIKILYKDRSGNLWIGTHGGGLNLFDPLTRKFKRLLSYKADLNITRSEIVTLLEDSYGTFWVGSQSGLRIFNKEKTDLKPLMAPSVLKTFEDKNIKVLFEDSRKNIWIAATTGLYVYSKTFNTIRSYKLPKGSNSVSTNSNYINCIVEDARGNIWLGLYYGGLTYYDPRINKFAENYTTKDGLSHNNVVGIIEDNKQQLWISTSNGLNKFDPMHKTFQIYTTSDGLAGDEFNYNSFFASKNGELFFGGYNGLTHFFPNQIQKNNYKAPIEFTGLRLFNMPVKINAPDGLLQEDPGFTKKLRFKHDQNVFTIEFALLNYIKSDKNKYAYKLKGINDQWIETNTPAATYTNLPPGVYSLLVKGANNDGVWSVPMSLQIEILPPFYKTWWAFCIYAILVIVILFFITRFFYLRQLIAKDKELHQVKLNFFTNVSHEIRTHLTLIMAPIESMMNDNQNNATINKHLTSVKNNADRLLKLVSELLDFRKAETKNLKLHLAEHNLVSFIQDIYNSFTELSRKKNIKFSFHYEEDPILLDFDKEQLEKVFFNLISNAFKFTPEGGSITIGIQRQKNKVIINVADTGRGIAAEYLDRLFTNFFQVDDYNIQNTGYGIGLALSKNIVMLHNGEIDVTSVPSSGNSPGNTNFTVTLLAGKPHFKSTSYLPTPQTPHDADLPAEMNVAKTAETTQNLLQNTVQKRSILVVEDHYDLRLLIKESLEDNYHVSIAENGLDGWKKAITEIPELIISDVMMPEMDGFTLCNKLKSDERTSHIPVVLLTAKTAESDLIQGLSGGADLYLTKPFSKKVLQLSVGNLLMLRDTMRRKFSQSFILEPTHINVDSMDEKFLSKLVQIIEDNMENEHFGVEILSEKIGMSQSVLYKKIKALTDMSVNDFSKSIRLKRAAQLLQEKQFKVYEIGYMVGFADRKYFSREFKKQFGTTPTEYNKKMP